jgi:hypothetical protein
VGKLLICRAACLAEFDGFHNVRAQAKASTTSQAHVAETPAAVR